MTDRVINSTTDLFQMLRNHWRGQFLYRGEDSASYVLRSRFGRAQAANPAENTLAVERELIRDFSRYAVPMLTFTPGDEWDWLALAQHHGAATRLLDWTENALVATFFATRSDTMSDRVLYVLPVSDLTDIVDGSTPFSVTAPAFYKPRHISARIVAQSGVFTVHPMPKDLFTTPNLERWTIPNSVVPEIWTTLMTFGVHEASMFPDLDGTARHLNTLNLRV